MRIRKRPVETPEHSRILHAGDPPEELYVAHADGSFSEVTVSADGDNLNVAVRAAGNHLHLSGA